MVKKAEQIVEQDTDRELVSVQLGAMCVRLGAQNKDNTLYAEGERYLKQVHDYTSVEQLKIRASHNLRLLCERTGVPADNYTYMDNFPNGILKLTPID